MNTQKLKIENQVLKSHRAALVEYQDMDSLISAIETYLAVLNAIGNKKAQGTRLYSTKSNKKVERQLLKVFKIYCDEPVGRNIDTWEANNMPALFEDLVGQTKKAMIDIDTAANIYAEGYKTCSHKKQKILFAAKTMMMDVFTAINDIPNAWRFDITKEPSKRAA